MEGSLQKCLSSQRGEFVEWFVGYFPANTCGHQDSANAHPRMSSGEICRTKLFTEITTGPWSLRSSVLKTSRNKVVSEHILKNLLGCWWGEDSLVVSNGITHLWSGNYSSVCGHTWLDNLSVDGFFCSITIKIHQMEQSGFNVRNCWTECSVIGLTNEAEEQDQTPLKMNLSFHCRVQESLLISVSQGSA